MFDFLLKKKKGKYDDFLIVSADRQEVLTKIKNIMMIKNPIRRWRLIRESERFLLAFLISGQFENEDEAEFSSFMLSQFEVLRRRERNALLVFIIGIVIAVLMLVTLKG